MNDRQTKHETLGGAHVEDYGHIEADEIISCECELDEENWRLVRQYWLSRMKVPVIDEGGRSWEDMRIVVKSVSYIEQFEEYYEVTLELWRC